MRAIGILGAGIAALAAQAHAQATEEFVPEVLTIQESIPPGPNIFAMDQNWMGASRINVLNADDLSNKGNLSMGLTGHMALSGDGKTLYTASVYMKRITYGPLEAVVHEFDVPTLKIKREFTISDKLAHVETQPGTLRLTPDEAYLLAQNATPATSVSVIDLAAGAQIAEIPTPGCWTTVPAVSGNKFTTICGDGKLRSYSFGADGTFGEPKASGPIFDADADALFSNPARAGDQLLYLSFGGDIYVVSDAGEAPTLVEIVPVAKGIEGDWAPGGSEVIAYHAPSGVAFLLMHSGAYDGSHKNGAEEIWAYDVKNKKLLYRSVAAGENSVTVTQTETPTLYLASADEASIHRYEVDPAALFAAKAAGKAESMGTFVTLVLADQ